MPKMVRLDMALDTRYFPLVKSRFNPPGKRGYLYIGRNDPMKGTGFLSKLLLRLGNFRCGWIGSGSNIPGIPRISMPQPLTPEFMQRIAEDFDFFITTGIADPNPTTILESMAWGLPVICTPQSGYYETTYRLNIFHDDFDRSLEVLRQVQFADEDYLKNMTEQARNVVVQQYTWDCFVGTICKKIGIE
jgi:glycosyltransferase involved in cell wall biosynthesis